MPFFSSSPKPDDGKAWKQKSDSSSGSWGMGAWFKGSAAGEQKAPAPVEAPSASTRPAVTPSEAPKDKGIMHALSSNASKLMSGQTMAHSGDALPDTLKSVGRSLGVVETEEQTADRRAKKARSAHLDQIRGAGAASTERQAGMNHEASSSISDATKQQFVRDQHLAKIRKAGAASSEHQAGMEHETSSPLAEVTKKEYRRDHRKADQGLHGSAKLEEMYAKQALAAGSTTMSHTGVELQHAGNEMYEANNSSVGSAASALTGKLTGHNPQELIAHTANAAIIGGSALAATDPQRQANAKVAQAIHGMRMDKMDSDVAGWKDKSADAGDPQARKLKARSAIFSSMKAAASNQKLAGANLALNKEVAPQWEAKDTVGADATKFGYKANDTIKASDRDNGSLGEQIKQGASSTFSALSGGSSKAFDTTKLTVDEQEAVSKTKETTAGIRATSEARNAERAKNPEAQDSIWGKIKRFATTGSTTKLTSAETAGIASTKDDTKAIHDEAKARRESPDRQKVSTWQAIKNFGSSLIPGSGRKLGDTKGMTAENQKRIDQHTQANADMDTKVAAEGRKGFFGHRYTAQEKLERKANEAGISKITAEQSSGYSAKNLEDLAAARGKRADIKSVAAGGLTTAENGEMASARTERARIKTNAREHADFATEHDGATVRSSGRIGGMNSGAVTADETKSTIGGRIAQGVRGFGRQVKRVGRIFGGSSADANAMIKERDLTGAALTTASGITGEAAAIVATSTTGSGAAVKATRSGVSGVLKGSGEALEAIGGSTAAGQDKRDKTSALHSGDRFNEARTKGVDIRPTFEKSTAAEPSLAGGLKQAASSGLSMFSKTDTGKELIGQAKAEGTKVAAKAQGAVGLKPDAE